MFLETERLILRDFTAGDVDDLHEIFGDEETMNNTEPPYSKDKTQAFLMSFCVNRTSKGAYAAVLKSTGKVIGYVLFKPVGEPEVYEIGWIFNKAHWRKGYAYEVCSRLVRHGFGDMKLHKIFAEAIDYVKSVSLMKKLGMELEGVQRKQTRSNDGVWRDLFLYAILAEDYFAALRAEPLR